jgi:hypothetical protein
MSGKHESSFFFSEGPLKDIRFDVCGYRVKVVTPFAQAAFKLSTMYPRHHQGAAFGNRPSSFTGDFQRPMMNPRASGQLN